MKVETSHGVISIEQVGAGDVTVLFVHGNSSCKEIFSGQLQSSLGQRHRLVAVDLPGHGQSDNARDPHRTYCIPGYADVLRELVLTLGCTRYVVVGWSLGEHIAMELMARTTAPLGVVVTGSPPFAKSMQSIGEAFVPSMHMALTSKAVFSEEDALAYARATTTPDVSTEDFRFRAALRTDGQSRARMFAAVAEGLGVDQRHTVESVAIPFAIINGSEDPFVAHSYFDKPAYARLWRGSVQRLDGCGHAPFFEQPAQYNQLLSLFLEDCVTSG